MKKIAETLAKALGGLLDAIGPEIFWPKERQAAKDALAEYNNPDHVDAAPANVKAIIVKHLTDNGYDGLCCKKNDVFCSCFLADTPAGFMWCATPYYTCRPGYIHIQVRGSVQSQVIRPEKPAPAGEVSDGN